MNNLLIIGSGRLQIQKYCKIWLQMINAKYSCRLNSDFGSSMQLEKRILHDFGFRNYGTTF